VQHHSQQSQREVQGWQMASRASSTALEATFERYLQDKGKGRGGNYRRNAARELDRFAEGAAGDRGRENWSGVGPSDSERAPTWMCAFSGRTRHFAADRGPEQNTVKTYSRYLSTRCGWCVNEGYLEARWV